MNQERYSESLFGIEIFTRSGWDEAGDFDLQFYDVEFPFESMKQYNGSIVKLYNVNENAGLLEVYNKKRK